MGQYRIREGESLHTERTAAVLADNGAGEFASSRSMSLSETSHAGEDGDSTIGIG